MAAQATQAAQLQRYGRQMILPSIGREGQEWISGSKVLVVGAGGIGSTVITYLAAAGVTLTIVDHDHVDVSNLHRQIIHDSSKLGVNKAISAVERVRLLNPDITCTAVTEQLTCSNALALASAHDVVVDATDNFEARYVINDACVLAKKPLVTGSSVGLEGQVTVIIPGVTPCYRCLYPRPSLSESCRSCANAGVLGPVPGLIGCLEAIEALKLISAGAHVNSSTYPRSSSLVGSQLFYDGHQSDFMKFEFPTSERECTVCGPTSSIESMAGTQTFLDQCAAQATEAAQGYIGLLPRHQQLSAAEFWRRYSQDVEGDQGKRHLVVDVRAPVQFSMLTLALPDLAKHSSLESALEEASIQRGVLVNVPLKKLQDTLPDGDTAEQLLALVRAMEASGERGEVLVYALCRRGVDSTVATRLLHGILGDRHQVFNITGGMVAWRSEVDPSFPLY